MMGQLIVGQLIVQQDREPTLSERGRACVNRWRLLGLNLKP
jgi:hypothetical protein